MLNNKRIIMIHGLASKPPKSDLHNLWSKCVKENIKIEDQDFFDNMNKKDLNDVFRSAYWANAVPSHIEDNKQYVTGLRSCVNTVINKRKNTDFHVGTGDKVKAFFKDKGLDVLNVFSTALTIKDNVTRAMMEEVRLYTNDQYIADKMRSPLESELKDAWDKNKKVAILSHSMGTFIAYDVLWRFSHRSGEDYSKYRDRKVDLLVTIGSPLGDKVIQDLLFGTRYGQDKPRFYPANIKYWHNYACLGDIVAHDSTLNDDFHKTMKKLKLLPQKENSTRDYIKLYNPFITADKKPNPHKSYGYLIQPKLAKWLLKFLKDELK